jgi:hypothetical protein
MKCLRDYVHGRGYQAILQTCKSPDLLGGVGVTSHTPPTRFFIFIYTSPCPQRLDTIYSDSEVDKATESPSVEVISKK